MTIFLEGETIHIADVETVKKLYERYKNSQGYYGRLYRAICEKENEYVRDDS